SSMVIKSLSATTWEDSGAQDTISAPGLISFSVAGNFESAMHIDASVINYDSAFTPAMKLFKVGGTVQGADIHIAANISSVDLGAIQSSKFLVGTEFTPETVADFNLARTI